jgi:predicted ArsR family transcriptional regulator
MFNHMPSHTFHPSRDLNPIIGCTVGLVQLKQDISKKILGYLARQDWPVTTEMVAKALGVSWNTAQLHLYKLMAGGLVKGRRVGRQNQWIVVDKGKHDADTRTAES